MARFTVYLPDELRERAVDAGLNLSGLLRHAVIAVLRGGDSESGAGEVVGASPAPQEGDD